MSSCVPASRVKSRSPVNSASRTSCGGRSSTARTVVVMRSSPNSSPAVFAASLTPEDSFRAFTRMQSMQAATAAATGPYDFVLAPVSPVLPFAAESTGSDAEMSTRDSHFTVPFNQSGQPAASIHCGHSASGLPIGLQIAGRRFDDLGVLQMARFYESVRGPQAPWPEPASAGQGGADPSAPAASARVAAADKAVL